MGGDALDLAAEYEDAARAEAVGVDGFALMHMGAEQLITVFLKLPQLPRRLREPHQHHLFRAAFRLAARGRCQSRHAIRRAQDISNADVRGGAYQGAEVMRILHAVEIEQQLRIALLPQQRQPLMEIQTDLLARKHTHALVVDRFRQPFESGVSHEVVGLALRGRPFEHGGELRQARRLEIDADDVVRPAPPHGETRGRAGVLEFLEGLGGWGRRSAAGFFGSHVRSWGSARVHRGAAVHKITQRAAPPARGERSMLEYKRREYHQQVRIFTNERRARRRSPWPIPNTTSTNCWKACAGSATC